MGVREYFSTLKEFVGAAAQSRSYLAPRPLDTLDSVGLKVEETAARIRRPDDAVCSKVARSRGASSMRIANRYAHALKARGIGHGDIVSLMMENRIEFLAALIAISKLGAVASLINTNLRGRPLTHCVSVTQSKAWIFGEELSDASPTSKPI